MADKVQILSSIKKAIGLSDTVEDTDVTFDNDLIPIIDGQLSVLYANGIGNKSKRLYLDKNLTWDDFFDNIENDRGSAIQYVVLNTKLLFDPPLPATIKAMEESAKKSLYYARLEFDKL